MPSLEGTTCQYVTLLLDFMDWPHQIPLDNLVGSALLHWERCIPMDLMGIQVQLLFFPCTKLLFMPLKQNHSFPPEVLSVLAVNKLCACHCNDCRNVRSFWHCMVPPGTLLKGVTPSCSRRQHYYVRDFVCLLKKNLIRLMKETSLLCNGTSAEWMSEKRDILNYVLQSYTQIQH